MTPRSAGFAASVLCVVLGASACSGDSKETNARQSAAAAASSVLSALSSAGAVVPSAAAAAAAEGSRAAAAASSAASSAAASLTAGAAACDQALPAISAATKAGSYVTAVKIIGGCTTASISTSLKKDPGGVAAAMGICEIAANEAHAHGVGAVTVESVDGKELAIGVKGSPCIGEP
jgi:hypothetical protein